MIEIDVPSIDPIQHEPKVILGMTTRQVVCIIPGVLMGIGLYMLFSKFTITQDFKVFGALIGVGPAMLLGWVKPYNMHFEQYARLWFFNNFTAAKYQKRIYKTDSAVEEKQLTMKERQELEKNKKSKEIEEKKKKKNKR